MNVALLLLTWLLAGGYFAISLLHFYWLFGGTVGLHAAIPEVDGRPAFQPSRLATLVVATGLLMCALLILATSGVLSAPVPRAALLWLTRLLALVFFARAIGDFRLVGFFKRIRNSKFARLDTRVYSPLCLVLAIGTAVVGFQLPA